MAYLERRVAFDHERDSDIIEFLDSMTSHKANKLIRSLLRDYIKDQSSSRLERIEEKVDDLRIMLRSKTFVSESDHTSDDKNNSKKEILEANLLNIGV